ncbi:aminomethyltransferase family protein [Actinomadura sp. ATCC 31491]|uniref:Aminomethyltransferase family protein n=1 Tax=Actinomadura luzonensis TaxID=2805427 RepID=A0ABT0G0H5_9ACTN|nr:aminomethyltransferase family protein [Actinomadura luzonensis]
MFGEKAGWERVDFYAGNATGDERERPRGWAGRGWSSAVGAEHRATRTAAGLFDESSFAKIEVTGPDAAELLEHVCANRVAREAGAVTYTQALNRRGGIACDFTVTRRGEDDFLVVTGTAFGGHDLGWLRGQAARTGATARIADVTGQYACFALWGPRAGDVLAGLTPGPLDVPSMTSRETSVGDVPVLALAVSFVGEPGWELYCSSEYGRVLWETLWRAGRPHGLVAGGYRAIDSLRLEKGYRVRGADVGPETTPYEAGLGFCVKPGKDFVGRDALDPDPPRRLRCLVLADPRAVALGHEPVRLDGRVASRVTSGGYGYTARASIAYAYLPAGAGPGTPVEVEVEGAWVPGTVVESPL